jgi:hypothetical protein
MPPKKLKDGILYVSTLKTAADLSGVLEDVHAKGWTEEIKRAIEVYTGKTLPSSNIETIKNAFDEFDLKAKQSFLKALGVTKVNFSSDNNGNQLYTSDFPLKGKVDTAPAKNISDNIELNLKNDGELLKKYMIEGEREETEPLAESKPPKTSKPQPIASKKIKPSEETETSTPPSEETEALAESPPPNPSKGAPKPTAQIAETQEVEAEEHRKKEEKKIAVQERRVIDIPKAFKIIDKTNISKQTNKLHEQNIVKTIKNTMNTEVKPVATVAKMDELQAKRDAHFKFSYRKLKFNRPSDISQKSKQMLF